VQYSTVRAELLPCLDLWAAVALPTVYWNKTLIGKCFIPSVFDFLYQF
jgi:hypothetical protein